MENKLAKLIQLIHKLPDSRLDEVSEKVSEMLEEDQKREEPLDCPDCPRCSSSAVVRNGTRKRTQRYRCKDCGKGFSNRYHSVMWHSRSGEAVWKQIIRDTVEGKSIDTTADELALTHATTFTMRHKVLLAMEAIEQQEPTILRGVCELDETYVLESHKGKKLPEEYWRKARKHGAKAQKRGISSEQIAICTGLDRTGRVFAQTVNRATPSSEEVAEVFGERIEEGSLVLTDGARSYVTLEKLCKCDVTTVTTEENHERHVLHINTANAFHSFIKQRYDAYRGVATKNINRYNALFSIAFRANEDTIHAVYTALFSPQYNSFFSIEETKTLNLFPL